MAVTATTPDSTAEGGLTSAPGDVVGVAIAHDGADVVLEARVGHSGEWTELARAALAGTTFRLAIGFDLLPPGAGFTLDDLSLVDALAPDDAPIEERAQSALRRALAAQIDAIGRLERFDRESGAARLDAALVLLQAAHADFKSAGLGRAARQVRAGERLTRKSRKQLAKERPFDKVNKRVGKAVKKERKALPVEAPR
jgi:hypothetical protein